jgi:hypothetical protein
MNLLDQLVALKNKKCFVWISVSNHHDIRGKITLIEEDLIEIQDDIGANGWIVIKHIVMVRETGEMGQY